jgi:hypothetical protein
LVERVLGTRLRRGSRSSTGHRRDTRKNFEIKSLILLALPREGRDFNEINKLRKGLGNTCLIELQDNSAGRPKPFPSRTVFSICCRDALEASGQPQPYLQAPPLSRRSRVRERCRSMLRVANVTSRQSMTK